MRTITLHDKAIWLSDASHKSYQLTIGDTVLENDAISEESIKITAVAEDADQLEFSGCQAKTLRAEIIYTDESAIGETVELKAKAELNDEETAWIVLFTGTVAELTQRSADDVLSSLTAYDALHTAINLDLAEWYKTLTFPVTLEAFRSSLSEYLDDLGITLADDELPLDDMTIDETIDPESLAGRDVLIAIATLNGRYCVCGPDNVISFRALERLEVSGVYPANNLYPSADLYPNDAHDNAADRIERSEYSGLTYKNYNVKTIDKVVLREDEDDIGAIYGTGTNAYIVEGNFLLFGKSAEDLAAVSEAVYELVEGFVFTPAAITAIARPWLDLGDLVRVESEQNVIYTYVLQMDFSGVQNTTGSYVSAVNQARVKQLSSVNTQIIQLRGKSNKLVRDIEHMSSAIYNEDGSSKIEQNAEAIELKVSASDVCSVISQSADSISLSANRITITSDNFMLNPEGQEIAHLDVVMKVGQIQNEYQNAFLLTKGGDIYARSMYVGLNTITTNGITALAISCSTTLSVTGAISGGSTISANGAISGGSITVVGEAKANTVSCNNLNIGATGYSAKTLTWTPIYGSNGYTVVAYGLSPYSASKPTSVLGT